MTIFDTLKPENYLDYERAIFNLGRLNLVELNDTTLNEITDELNSEEPFNIFTYVLKQCTELEYKRGQEMGDMLQTLVDNPRVPFILNRYLSHHNTKYKGLVSHLFGNVPLTEVRLLTDDNYTKSLGGYDIKTVEYSCLTGIITPSTREESFEALKEEISRQIGEVDVGDRAAVYEHHAVRLASLRTFFILTDYTQYVEELINHSYNLQKNLAV